MSKNMYKLRNKLLNAKTGVGSTFTWSNESWFKKDDIITKVSNNAVL